MRFVFEALLSLLILGSTTVSASEGPTFKPYGRLKSSVVYASSPVNSFSFYNLSAPTSAAYATGMTYDQDLLSFQVSHSRFGADIEWDDVYGNVEVDFINFAISSPTLEARPRIRKAYVGYKYSDRHEFRLGQDWDVFSPAMPKVLNYIGLNFNAGNTGFIRNQFKWKYRGDHLKSTFSLGMTGKNPMSEVNAVEATTFPTLAYALDLSGFAASALYTYLERAGEDRSDIYGLSLSYKHDMSADFRFTTEIYTGQNMADAGLLGLSHWIAGRDQREAGGFISVMWTMPKQWGELMLNYGRAQILNTDSVGDYSYDAASQRIVEDGIRLNEVYRVYWAYPLPRNLKVVAEISHYQTSRNVAGNRRSDSSQTFETGLYWAF